MTIISSLVREYIEEKPYLQEALRQGIINFAALGEQIQEYLEQKLNTKLKAISVIMAIRRYQEKLSTVLIPKIHYGPNAEANVKTNLHMFTLVKSSSIFEKINKIMPLINFKSGGVLHVVQGNYQVALITNEGNVIKMRSCLDGEELIREDKNLVSIALKYADDIIDLPGSLFLLSRALAWENIPVIDLVETMSETSFIVKEKDATKALSKLTQVLKENP
ncbi:MAG: hypothetical protein AABX70_05400 [Nanoarchaeota archaeon]